VRTSTSTGGAPCRIATEQGGREGARGAYTYLGIKIVTADRPKAMLQDLSAAKVSQLPVRRGNYRPTSTPSGSGRFIPLADFEPSAIGGAENAADHVRCRVYRVISDIDLLGDLDSVIDLNAETRTVLSIFEWPNKS
jgi:hypothetical protein